jgi:hypothetical protein
MQRNRQPKVTIIHEDPKAKVQEPVTAPAVASADASKRKDKLRDRTGGKERIMAVGDEPTNGPDLYYCLKDLEAPGILIALTEELDTPLQAIFRVEDALNAKKGENNSIPTPNTNWSQLRTRSKQGMGWRSTAWSSFQASEFKDHKEIFEMLALRIYGIVDRRKIYDLFYRGDRVISIPNCDEKGLDLRFYEYLLNLIDEGKEGLKVESIVALAMEYLRRIHPQSEQTVPDLAAIGLGNLKALFEKEIERLAVEVGDERENYDEKILKNTTVVEYEDAAYILGMCMSSLRSIEIDGMEIIKNVVHTSSSQRYLQFLDQLQVYSGLRQELIVGEGMKFQTEFYKLIQSDLDYTRVELLLALNEFEALCGSGDMNANSASLDGWRWIGNLSQNALIQALDGSKQYKPQVYHKLSPFHGKLLLMFQSPGPIGCLEYSEEHETKVRTKVAFSAFCESYDPISRTMSDEKPNEDEEKTGVAYELGEPLSTVKEEVKYLYPYHNTQIKVVKTISPSSEAEIFTKLYHSNHCISFAGDGQSKHGPNFTFRFCDDSVFSMVKNEQGVLAQFSVGKLHVSLANQGSITVQGFPIENTPTSKLNPVEVKRAYLPNGVVVKYFENKSLRVLYPDGSSASQQPGKPWVSINRNGEGDGILRRIVQETHLPDETTAIIREDFTTIEQLKEKIVAKHNDGIEIETYSLGKHSIRSEDGLTVEFDSDGAQTISIGANFSVSRGVLEGRMAWISLKRVKPVHVGQLQCICSTSGRYCCQFLQKWIHKQYSRRRQFSENQLERRDN